MYCDICRILSSVSVDYSLCSGLIYDICLSRASGCRKSRRSACIDTDIFIVVYVRFSVYKCLAQSKLSCTVKYLGAWSCCSCRLIQFTWLSYFVVMYGNIACVISLIVIGYRLIAALICTVLIAWYCHYREVRNSLCGCCIRQTELSCSR